MDRGRRGVNEVAELRVEQWFHRRRVKVILLIKTSDFVFFTTSALDTETKRLINKQKSSVNQCHLKLDLWPRNGWDPFAYCDRPFSGHYTLQPSKLRHVWLFDGSQDKRCWRSEWFRRRETRSRSCPTNEQRSACTRWATRRTRRATTRSRSDGARTTSQAVRSEYPSARSRSLFDRSAHSTFSHLLLFTRYQTVVCKRRTGWQLNRNANLHRYQPGLYHADQWKLLRPAPSLKRLEN